jgi:hypothetical protein
MPQSSSVKIDRFLLKMPGGSAAQGRKVAELVAAGLAAAGGLPQAGDLPNLRVAIRESAGGDPEVLARHIVAETLRALALNT